MTRPSASTSTPCQSASGASLSQLLAFSHAVPFIVSYTAVRTTRSVDGLSTCTAAVAVTAPAVAVTVVSPLPTAVMSPCASTVAVEGSPDRQVTSTPGNGRAFPSRTVAVRWKLAPRHRITVEGAMLIDAGTPGCSGEPGAGCVGPSSPQARRGRRRAGSARNPRTLRMGYRRPAGTSRTMPVAGPSTSRVSPSMAR